MEKHPVAWSESQRKIVLAALDLSLERMSEFLKSPDKLLRERHESYARLRKEIASRKADKDGAFRVELDQDSAALIKAAVVSYKAGGK